MLTIDTKYNNGILIIRVKGNLNNENIDYFNREVIDRISIGGIRNIVYNFNDLEQIDLKGIYGLLYSYELCKQNDGCILMCSNKSIKDKLKRNKLLNYILEVSNELVATKIINMRVR